MGIDGDDNRFACFCKESTVDYAMHHNHVSAKWRLAIFRPLCKSPAMGKWLLILLTIAHAAAAPTAEKNQGKRQLRFLPVGDMPPFRQEIRNGVRYELEPDPGSIPPGLVQLSVGKDKAVETTLNLGNFSPSLPWPAGLQQLELMQKTADVFKKWHEVTLPEQGDLAVLLWRDPKVNSWESARSAVLGDGLEAFPAGSIRLVNTIPSLVKMVFADKAVELKPGVCQVEVLSKEITPVQISAQDAKGDWHVAYQSALTQNPGERGNVIVYRADGESPRSPVKVLCLREQAPVPPEKKPPPVNTPKVK
jgi:hypothetical protein